MLPADTRKRFIAGNWSCEGGITEVKQMNIYLDSKMADHARRKNHYDGSICVDSTTPSGLKLCQPARELAEEDFYPLTPINVHGSPTAEKCAEVLAVLKPPFIHHPRAKEYIREMLTEVGCDLEETYFDVPASGLHLQATILNQESPMRFILIATRGTGFRCVGTTGGCLLPTAFGMVRRRHISFIDVSGSAGCHLSTSYANCFAVKN
jgi:hypothetical protein